MGKMFKLGIIIGRFQTFHNGHKEIIDSACKICERVGVLIGSSQEFGTLKNPFSFAKRKQILEKVYGNKIEIYPLPDIGVGNNSEWGKYVLKQIIYYFRKKPDVFISGKEERRNSWFDDEEFKGIGVISIDKKINISATELRECLIQGDKEKWKQYVPKEIHNEYEIMRQIMLTAKNQVFSASV